MPRDGLKENKAFRQLQKFTQAVIKQLEVRRFRYRDKAGLGRSTRNIERKLKPMFSFDEMKQDIRNQLEKGDVAPSTADGIMQIVGRKENETHKGVDEYRQAVALYQGQATLGKIINVIIHEGRRPLSYFRNCIPHLKYWIDSFQKSQDPGKFERIVSITNGILENMEFLVKLFKRLDPLAAGKRGPRKTLELTQSIQHAVFVFENEMKSADVSVEINGPDDFKFSGWSQDIYAIFTKSC